MDLSGKMGNVQRNVVVLTIYSNGWFRGKAYVQNTLLTRAGNSGYSKTVEQHASP